MKSVVLCFSIVNFEGNLGEVEAGRTQAFDMPVGKLDARENLNDEAESDRLMIAVIGTCTRSPHSKLLIRISFSLIVFSLLDNVDELGVLSGWRREKLGLIRHILEVKEIVDEFLTLTADCKDSSPWHTGVHLSERREGGGMVDETREEDIRELHTN
nr:hypothetical protein Itr_chr05CG01210 [Ipomoea trifida]